MLQQFIKGVLTAPFRLAQSTADFLGVYNTPEIQQIVDQKNEIQELNGHVVSPRSPFLENLFQNGEQCMQGMLDSGTHCIEDLSQNVTHLFQNGTQIVGNTQGFVANNISALWNQMSSQGQSLYDWVKEIDPETAKLFAIGTALLFAVGGTIYLISRNKKNQPEIKKLADVAELKKEIETNNIQEEASKLEEEVKQKQLEEEAKQKQLEEEAKQKQLEEEAKQKQLEEEKKRREEESKKREEEARQKQLEEEKKRREEELKNLKAQSMVKNAKNTLNSRNSNLGSTQQSQPKPLLVDTIMTGYFTVYQNNPSKKSLYMDSLRKKYNSAPKLKEEVRKEVFLKYGLRSTDTPTTNEDIQKLHKMLDDCGLQRLKATYPLK